LLALAIILVQFVGLLIFICVGWNFTEYVLLNFGIVDLPLAPESIETNKIVDQYAMKTIQVRALSLFTMALILQPLVLRRTLSGLTYFSMANLMILIYIIGITVAQTPKYVENLGKATDFTIEYFIKTPSMNWWSGISTLLLSYFVQPSFFYVRSELIKPSKPRVTKVITVTVVMETIVYLAISVAGYLSLGDTYMVDLYTLRPKLGSIKYLT